MLASSHISDITNCQAKESITTKQLTGSSRTTGDENQKNSTIIVQFGMFSLQGTC